MPRARVPVHAQFYGVHAYGANGGDVVRNYSAAAGGGLVKVDNGSPAFRRSRAT